MFSFFQPQKLRFEFSRLRWNFRYGQLRSVVSVHHFCPCAHGQETGCQHFQVGGRGHARGHGRQAGRGRKGQCQKFQLTTTPRQGWGAPASAGHETHGGGGAGSARSGHLGSRPMPRLGFLLYELRARRGRTPSRPRPSPNRLSVRGAGLRH